MGRLFRLLPLYWVALSLALVMAALGLYGMPAGFSGRPVMVVLVNATMGQALVGAPLVIGLSWTLGYELIFYLIMSAIFLLGCHRRTRSIAWAAAIVALALGALDSGHVWLACSGMVLVAGTVGGATWLKARPARRLWAGAVLGVMVACLFGSRYAEAWFNVSVVAVMFAGTVLYRHHSERLTGRAAFTCYLGAALLICSTVFWQAGQPSWGITFVAAFSTFGLLYLLHHRRFPRPVVWLGTVSYSLYLFHPLVYAIVPRTAGVPVLGFIGAIVIAVALSMVTHRWIELPMIVMGRRVASKTTIPRSVRQ